MCVMSKVVPRKECEKLYQQKSRHCSACQHFEYGRMNHGCKAGEVVTVTEFNYPDVHHPFCEKYLKIGE